MNKKEAGKLLGKFWRAYPGADDLDDLIYWIDLWIEFLYSEGYEIGLKEFVSNEVDKEEQ